jgi:hypothetical protein
MGFLRLDLAFTRDGGRRACGKKFHTASFLAALIGAACGGSVKDREQKIST